MSRNRPTVPMTALCLGPICIAFGRLILVAVVLAAALAYLAICIGRALEDQAADEKQPIGKRTVTSTDSGWIGRQGEVL